MMKINSREAGVGRREYKKILIIRLDRIGDVLLSTPVIKALRDAYPDSHIAFMVRPYAEDIVKGNPYLDEVMIYDKDGSEKGLSGNLKFASMLARKKFDLALILHPTSRSHLVSFLAGIPCRVGYDRKLGILLTKRIPHVKQLGLKHEIEYSLDLLRYIGIDARDKALYMPLNEKSEEKIDAIFTENGIKDNDELLVINPGASCPSKRWSPEKFAKVGDELALKNGFKVVIIAGIKDKICADLVLGFMKNKALNLSGRTTIADIASVLKRSKLFISNDSGPVHIACAVGVPVITIFGRSDRGLAPTRWGPTGKKDIYLHKDMGCDICLAHNCRDGFKCLEAVAVDDVLSSAEKILGDKRK